MKMVLATVAIFASVLAVIVWGEDRLVNAEFDPIFASLDQINHDLCTIYATRVRQGTMAPGDPAFADCPP